MKRTRKTSNDQSVMTFGEIGSAESRAVEGGFIDLMIYGALFYGASKLNNYLVKLATEDRTDPSGDIPIEPLT
jgi:hypothetical protein